MKRQAFNPYLPSYEYVPDGEPYVFGDRVYVYDSHDKFNGEAYCENDYVCWSADVNDLGNWKYEGIIYKKTQDPMCNGKPVLYGNDRLLFAPDVQISSDGRYYLYYAFDFLGIMAVAVCDTPAGEYEFYEHIHYADGTLLGEKEGDPFQFDPGVLVDDDGRVYLYSGFRPVNFPWTELGGQQVAEIPVTAKNDWTIFSAPMKIENGVKALYFTYKGDRAVDFMSFTIN